MRVLLLALMFVLVMSPLATHGLAYQCVEQTEDAEEQRRVEIATASQDARRVARRPSLLRDRVHRVVAFLPVHVRTSVAPAVHPARFSERRLI